MRSIIDILSTLRPNAKMRKPLSPLIKRLFLLSFMSEFIVIYPFYVIMFGERGGVSAAGVGVLLAIWMIVSVLSEVPTGVIADKFSKKWSLVIGHVMQLLTFAIWLAEPNFTGYLVGFVIWGIGEAFLSGASQAYLYESLDEDSRKAFGKVYSRTRAFRMLAYTTAYFIAFLIGPRYSLLLVLSMVVSAVSIGITLSLPSTLSKVEVELRPKIMASALHAIRHSPGLWQIMILAVVVAALMGSIGEYMPAYYHQIGLPLQTVALWMSFGSGATALIYWWMHHIEDQLARYRLPILLATTGLFTLSFLGGPVVAALGIFVITRLLRVMTVSYEAAIQHHAPDESRATVGSLFSLANRLIIAGGMALVGSFAIDNKIVMPIRWGIIIGVAIFAALAFYFLMQKKRLLKVSVKAEA